MFFNDTAYNKFKCLLFSSYLTFLIANSMPKNDAPSGASKLTNLKLLHNWWG